MKKLSRCKSFGILGSTRTYAEEQLPTISKFDSEQIDSTKVAKDFRKGSDDLSKGNQGEGVMGIEDVSETTKGRMSLRKRILLAVKVERLFRKYFPTVSKEEMLLDAHKCSLFTTAGQIKGRIFVTSERIAFHSKKLLKLETNDGEVAKFPYKVSIPLSKVKKIVPSKNLNKPEEKYVQIVAVDDFEFWFMCFVNYRRSFASLRLAIYGEQ